MKFTRAANTESTHPLVRRIKLSLRVFAAVATFVVAGAALSQPASADFTLIVRTSNQGNAGQPEISGWLSRFTRCTVQGRCTYTMTYEAGATAGIEVFLYPGATFVWISGPCSGSTNPCVFTMDSDKTAELVFTPPPNKLSVTVTGTGLGTVTSSPAGINCSSTCDATFADNTVVTLTAAPSSGHAFTGWSGVCGGTGDCVVTMSIDKSVTATFALVPKLKITAPASKAVVPLTELTSRQTKEIPFTATSNVAGTIKWTGKFSYTTSGGVGPFTSSFSFTSQPGVASMQDFLGSGGELSVTAKQSTVSASLKAYVVGNPAGVPNAEITKYLTQLYKSDHLGLTGYTPDLLAHIAVQESAYRQFDKAKTLYGVKARWPIENFPTSAVPAGKYIGLLQAQLKSIKHAFDWKENAEEGLEILKGKLSTVLAYQAQQQKAIKGLKAMTGRQVEDSALLLYGGFGARTAPPECEPIAGQMRFYIPKGTAWVVNPAVDCRSNQGNTSRDYVTGVRNKAIPK